MINISVDDIDHEDSHGYHIFIGGNKEPSIALTIPCHQYDETIKAIMDNLLSSRSYVWEQEKMEKPEKETDLKIKEKSKIISLEKTIAKDQDKFLKKVKEIGEDINDQT
jgi:hypothetical protein